MMKLFRTSSANIVKDCQKFFHFLLISYLIDIRTAKFLENVIRNENCVCKLFAHIAQCSLNKIFLSYDADISSPCNLRNFIVTCFLNDNITYDIIVHVYLVKFFFLLLYATVFGEIKVNILSETRRLLSLNLAV